MRNTLYRILHQLYPLLPKRRFKGVIFPFYHAVSNEPRVHYKHLFELRTVEAFQADLDYLQSNYRALSLEEAIAYDSNEPAFHLSFDDGFSECYELIAPILEERGLSATFFLNPEFLDNKGLMHRCKASVLTEAEPEKRGEFMSIRYRQKGLLDALAIDMGIDWEEYLQIEKPYMSVEQVQDLAKRGFSIGSHSLDHPEFPLVSPEQQVEQIKKSQQELEHILGLRPDVFAFPFEDLGADSSCFEALQQNYLASFGTSGIKKDPRANHLQRLDMEKAEWTGKEWLEMKVLLS